MTHQMYLLAAACAGDIVIAAKKLLKIAEDLGPEDVDTSISIADSIAVIGTENVKICDRLLDLGKSFDKLKTKAGINFLGEVPTIGRYP